MLPSAKRTIRLNYTHDALIDEIIANPGTTGVELGRKFGYGNDWISTVMSTDLFKEKLAQRRAAIVDPELIATVQERFTALATLSLQKLQARLAGTEKVSDNLLLRAVELGARGVGAGGFAPAGTVAPAAPPSDNLARLAERLVELQGGVRRRLEAGPDGVMDVPFTEVSAA